MKQLLFVSFVLFLCITCVNYSVLAQSTAETSAEKEWNSIDPTNEEMLDQFIERYPNTEMAKLAFLTRYFLLTQDPTIDHYNAFLAKYPQKFQSQMALQDVFNLYKDQNRAAVWLDFLRRYPGTQQGLAAKLHLQTLMAQFTMISDTEEIYDDFIVTFPDAPQIPAMMDLAEKKVTAKEQALFAKIEEDYSGDYQRIESERRKRANEIVVNWGVWITDYNDKFADIKTPIIDNGAACMLADRIRRYEKIIILVYKQYPAAREVRAENRHRELIAKLDAIQQTLLNNHRELVRTIREESAATRKVLKEEFAKLGLRFDAGFEILGRKMDVLHNDMVSVYQELQKVNVNLENIQAEIQRSNSLLEKIDTDLNETRNAMLEGFTSTQKMLVQLGDKMDNVSREVADFKYQTITRLDTVIEKQDKSYALQVKQFEMQVETLAVTKEIRQGQEVLIANSEELIGLSHQQIGMLGNIQQTQVAQLNAINGLRGDVHGLRGDVQGLRGDVQGLRGDVQQGFAQTTQRLDVMNQNITDFRQETAKNFAVTNENLKTGFADVKNSVYDVGSQILTSNQQTFQRIRQQQTAARKSSGGGGLFGGLFNGISDIFKGDFEEGVKGVAGGVVQAAGTIVGGVYGGPAGAAIGTTIGAGLSSAIQGGSEEEIISTAVNTGLNQGIDLVSNKLETEMPSWKTITYPNTNISLQPAQQIFDNVVEQGKNVLKKEIQNKINDSFPPQTVPLINSLLSGNFEQRKALAIKTIASQVSDTTGLSQSAVQRILSSRNEQELKNNIVQTSQEHTLNPSAVMYAMDYIL